MDPDALNGSWQGAGCRVSWSEATWDRPHFGGAVVQITSVEVEAGCSGSLAPLMERWRQAGVVFVSCRIPAARVAELIWMQQQGLHVIETALHPELRFAADQTWSTNCIAEPAQAAEVALLSQIAEGTFGFERLHADPRVPNSVANRRYGGWVANSFGHESQRLWSMKDETGSIVGFFVTQAQADGYWYWHLAGIAPEVQGRGVGTNVWRAMLLRTRADGALGVRTCVTARNSRIQRLYWGLGFRFAEPAMTLHAVLGDIRP